MEEHATITSTVLPALVRMDTVERRARLVSNCFWNSSKKIAHCVETNAVMWW